MRAPHISVEPNILYLGTPVVLISTVNEDGT
jgi:flavin reductase (DIM6/NTAB) family NADH-FMN oxidoreductase RutF